MNEAIKLAIEKGGYKVTDKVLQEDVMGNVSYTGDLFLDASILASTW